MRLPLTRQQRNTLLPGLLAVLIGLGLFAGALYAWLNTRSFLSTTLRADGEVTAFEETLLRGTRTGNRPSSDQIGYKPVVTFRVNGQTHTLVGSAASSSPAYELHEKVQVAFPPGRPEQARLLSFFELHTPTLVLSLLGLIFTLPGAILTYVFFPRRP